MWAGKIHEANHDMLEGKIVLRIRRLAVTSSRKLELKT